MSTLELPPEVHIDVHESIVVKNKLEKLGIPTKQKARLSADIQLGEWGLERKSMSDLLLSSRSVNGQPPRLWNQLYRLRQSFPNRAALCITGTPEDVIRKGFEFNYGKYMSIKARCLFGGLHVPALEFKDEEDLALFLSKGYEILGKPSTRPVPYTPSKAPDRVVIENMLCQIQGIGIKTVRLLLGKIGVQSAEGESVATLCLKNEKELISIIGSKGKEVYHILHNLVVYHGS